MAEPATISFSAFAAAMSAATLALFGVDYYSLLYGLVGALLTLPHVDRMGRVRAVIYVALSTLAGAVIGSGFVAWLGSTSRPLLIVGCLVGGVIAQALAGLVLQNLPRLFNAALKRVGVEPPKES